MTQMNPSILSDAQLRAELDKCEFCTEMPCKTACPSEVSPADFIMAARIGKSYDFKRSAALIYSQNPLGATCGAACPDAFCMNACTHEPFDGAVNIPAVQATIIHKASQLNALSEFSKKASTGKKVAVIGAGPAGMGAASLLAQEGVAVDVFEKETKAGGMCNLIPDNRLDKSLLELDIAFNKSLGDYTIHYDKTVDNPVELLQKGYDSIIVSTGLDTPFKLNIPGSDYAILWDTFIKNIQNYTLADKKVAVIGGGAVALDCASYAKNYGASDVDLICLEKPAEMNLDTKERWEIFHQSLGLISRTSIQEILPEGNCFRFSAVKMQLLPGKSFHPANMKTIEGSEHQLSGYDFVVFAIGAKSSFDKVDTPNIFYAGDMVNGPTTVVEAVAAGKNIGKQVLAKLNEDEFLLPEKATKSTLTLSGHVAHPVSLEAEFFGKKIDSPFLLSAAPPSDGYDQMKLAYEAGWAGGVMKTAFDNLDIHIPNEYMFVLDDTTFGNCDNVSDHPLDRLCGEIRELVKEFPDKLTLASTGGPITGDDNQDKLVWQSNTKKLEDAGVMGIEYSLSCPQGGDGTKGDIAAQDPELTAKIVDWVMETAKPEIPKLFKLTGAVTVLYPILKGIEEVLAKYPNKKAGITLANSFPGLDFRESDSGKWDEGVIIGLSGKGITPISNLSLANASRFDLTISGNGGPMDYKAAAHFLALGVETVQFCSIVMKYGYGIINDLKSGLSHLMEDKNIKSVKELIGSALPNPVTGFMELSPVKKISSVDEELCVSCGNCTSCPYLAIELNDKGIPEIDPARCISCSFCTKNCFAGALSMRERTQEETDAMHVPETFGVTCC